VHVSFERGSDDKFFAVQDTSAYLQGTQAFLMISWKEKVNDIIVITCSATANFCALLFCAT